MGARKVDVVTFKKALDKAEAGGGLATLGILYETTSKIYNENLPPNAKPITGNIVKSNIAELNLTVKTVNGRAKAAAVDMQALRQCVTQAEKDGPKGNRSQLFADVADKYNAATGQNCSGATLQQIVNKAGWELKTPKGKPGGRAPGTVVNRRPRAEKLAADPNYATSVKQLRATIPLSMMTRLEKTVQKAEAGSLTARLKLKCLDCTAFQPVEIRDCDMKSCSLWPVRPYRGKSTTDDDGDELSADDLEAAKEETIEA
jgi:hypothetical protein